MAYTAVVMLAVACVTAAGPTRYERVDLPFPEGINRLVPAAISNTGLIGGWSSGPFNAGGAFTWTAGEGVQLVTNGEGVNAYNVMVISDAGAIGGRTLIGGPGSTTQGIFRRVGNAPPAIAPGLAAQLGGFVTGINDAGVSTGWWLRRRADQSLVGSAWVFSAPSTLTPIYSQLPEPDSQSQTAGINNAGQVAGWTTIANARRAFRWSSDTGAQIVQSPVGFDVNVVAINQAGQIVGDLYNGSGRRAMRIVENAGELLLEDLSPQLAGIALSSRGDAINDLGHVAGRYTRLDGAQRAFFLVPGSTPIDLGDVLGDVMAVTGINNRDEVVFTAMDDIKTVRPYYWSSATGLVLLSEATDPPIDFPSFSVEPIGVNDRGMIVLEQAGEAINTAATILLTPHCAGDTNNDGSVNAADLSVLLSSFGNTLFAGVGGDTNADGVVNAADLSVLLSSFGCHPR